MLRWLPALGLALLHAVLWPLFLLGGLRAIVAWIALLLGLPAVSVLVLVALGIFTGLTRRFTLAMGVAAALALPGLWPGLWNFGIGAIAFPYSLANAKPALTVRLPSNQPLRVAWGGDSVSTNVHAMTPDQRWAYDLVVEPCFTGSTKPEDYGCWGTDVVAPFAGVVHVAHDGEPDQVPNDVNVTAPPLGNHVVLQTPEHTYLVIAHLQKNSLRVSEGARVAEGEVLGRCGNSGHTSEPHIHIHHQRQDPARFPVNFAEGLPLYFRDHDGPPMPTGGLDEKDGKVVPRGPLVRHLR